MIEDSFRQRPKLGGLYRCKLVLVPYSNLSAKQKREISVVKGLRGGFRPFQICQQKAPCIYTWKQPNTAT